MLGPQGFWKLEIFRCTEQQLLKKTIIKTCMLARERDALFGRNTVVFTTLEIPWHFKSSSYAAVCVMMIISHFISAFIVFTDMDGLFKDHGRKYFWGECRSCKVGVKLKNGQEKVLFFWSLETFLTFECHIIRNSIQIFKSAAQHVTSMYIWQLMATDFVTGIRSYLSPADTTPTTKPLRMNAVFPPCS